MLGQEGLVFDPDVDFSLRRQAKAVIRKRARALRNSIPEAARLARSEKIVERVVASAPFERARSVGLFWPMLERGEVDVRGIDSAARERGKRVAYPFLEGDSEMRLAYADPASLEERGHGFVEPPESAPAAETDELVVIVPALAVDPTGQRIGYGKGFYDRLLARIRPPAFAIAVAYDFEVVPEVPVTEHDQRVDMVLTDLRIWQIAPA
jgi:5-formyltetrahydrofolate cyclo-ligase